MRFGVAKSTRVTKFVPDDTFHCVKSLPSVAGLHQSGIAVSETTRIYSFCARIFGYAVLMFAALLLSTTSPAQSQNASAKPGQKPASTSTTRNSNDAEPAPDLS